MLRRGLGIFLVVLTVVLVFIGYQFDWTGFDGRKLWDWLELIIIPVLLFLLARYLVEASEKREQQRQETQKQIEATRLLEEEQSRILQDYFDRMQTLILDKDLYKAKEGSQVANLARSITLLTLQRLKPEHKGAVIMFLDSSGLIQVSSYGRIVSLSGAKLQGLGSPIGIAEMNLQGVDLRAANLVSSKLDMPNLQGADLMLAVLDDARLIGADLRGANLAGASVEKCNLCWAIFDEDTILPNGKQWTANTKITEWGAIEIPPFTEEELIATRREFLMDVDETPKRNIGISESNEISSENVNQHSSTNK